MSCTSRRNENFFKFLSSCPHHQQQLLLETATPEQIHTLCESVYQVFKGNIPLNPSEKENLGEHEKHMIQLAYGHVPYKEKKTILVQHGAGFVDTLLKPVITALAYAML